MATTEVFYNGDGSDVTFTITFEYLEESDVKVSVGGVLKTQDTDYTFSTLTEITFNTAPPSGTNNVRIFRDTATDNLRNEFFAGSAIRAQDLNDNSLQTLYKVQEVSNYTWNNQTNTIHSNESWVSNDNQIATTAALDARFQDELSETITSSETWANDDDTIATTAAIDDQIDNAITNDILVNNTGLTKSSSGGQTTLGIGAGAVGLDRIKAADIIVSGESNPNNDTTIASTAKIDDMIDEAITGDILVNSTGLTKSTSGGQTTLGIGANSVDLDRIKSDDIVATSAYASTWTNEDDKVATAGALAARHDLVVNTDVNPPSTAQVGKQWLSTAPGNQVHKIYDGSGWRTVAVGQPYSPATTTVVRYVDVTNGSDASDVTGFLPQAPLRSIGRALTLINASSSGDGSLIKVAPGVYQETLPLRIKKNNVSIVGESMRSCFVHPTVATENNDMFEVDSGTYIANLTLLGLKVPTSDQGSRNNSLDNDATYGLPSNQPFSVRFRTDTQPTILKSPYIQNCTHFSDAHFDNANFDPNTFPSTDGQTYSAVAGDESSAPCGGGLLVDGSAVSSSSPIRSMVVDAFTQITLDGPGILVTNNGYAQLVSFFGTFAHYHAKAKNGGQINLSNCVSDFGRYGLIADGKSPSAIATATASAANSGATTITIGAITTAGSFHGTVSRPLDHMMVTIDGVDYGVVSSTANGAGWDIVLTSGLTSNITNTTVSFALRSYISTGGHTFEFVGVGTDYGDHPDKGGVPVEANQVIELNGGKVWQSSTDHVGKFKAGDVLVVDQVSETVDLKATTVTGNLAVTGTVDGRDVAADGTKLDGIETGATADQTAAEIRTLVESASDSNVFTDADHTKLNGIETGATADQTATEIKTAYESNSNTNAFTDAEKTKLSGIATGAEVNVNADWNASSGDAQILNKPTLYSDSSVDSHLNQSSASANEVLAWNGSDYTWVAQTTGYSNSSVDAHLNQSTAATNEVLSWNGSDYDWVAQSSGGLSNIVSDTTPQLGGNLDVNGKDIVSVSNGDIDLDPNGSGVVVFKGNSTKGSGQFKLNCEQNSHGITIKGPAHSAGANYTLTLPTTDGSANEVLKTDGSGNLSWTTQSGGLSNNATTGSNNFGIGTNALDSNTASGAEQNTAFGVNALTALNSASADYNTAVGYGAGRDLTTASGCTFLGTNAGESTTTGIKNVYLGAYAGGNKTTADSNVIIGYGAGSYNSSGSGQVFVGKDAGKYATGTGCVAVGSNSLDASGCTGEDNTAVGYEALGVVTTGEDNTAIGSNALKSITTNDGCTAVGSNALQYQTAGSATAVGYNAGIFQTTGGHTTYVGWYSGFGTSGSATASFNTYVGSMSGYSASSGGYNVGMGYQSVYSNTTGAYNTGIGHAALRSNTTASGNTAVGYASLYSNTTGSGNVAVGYQALEDVTTGYSNTAIGYRVGEDLTTGNNNTLIGMYAGTELTTGHSNTAIGRSSLYLSTNGAYNIAIGYASLYRNTSGYYNVAIGYEAVEENQTGAEITAVGYKALNNTTVDKGTAFGFEAGLSATSASGVTFLGWKSGRSCSSGADNTGVGAGALESVNTGSLNTAIGRDAGGNITTGQNCTVIGYNATASAANATNEITLGNSSVTKLRIPGMQSSSADGYVLKYNHSNGYISLAASSGLSDTSSHSASLGIGTGALANETGNYNTALGVNALDGSVSGVQNTAIGNSTLTSLTSGEYNTAVGMWAGYNITTAVNNTFIGAYSGSNATTNGYNVGVGYGSLYTTTGTQNTAVGYNAGFSQTTASENTLIGAYAGDTLTSGQGNVALGRASLTSATTSSSNVAIGVDAMEQTTTGAGNVTVGCYALQDNTTGGNNVAVGYNAGHENTTSSASTYVGGNAGHKIAGAQNTAIGYNALSGDTTAASAYYNVAIGVDAAENITTGHSNVFIGWQAAKDVTTGNNLIVIGKSATPSSVTADNEITLGNTDIDTLRIPGLTFSAANGSVLTYNSSTGKITFAAPSGLSDASNLTLSTGLSGDGTALDAEQAGAGTYGNGNTAVGAGALTDLTTGYDNVAVGTYAGFELTTGQNCVYIGNQAGENNTTGRHQTFVGRRAGMQQAGNENVAVGYDAMKGSAVSSTGIYNVAVGVRAGFSNTAGRDNTFVGYNSGEDLTTATYTTLVGTHAGYDITTGTHNTCIGSYAGYNITTGANNTCLGKNAETSSSTASGEFVLGDTSVSTLRCNTSTISSLSDGRDKTEVEDLPLGLDFINTLRPVKFKWDTRDGNIKDGTYDAGFIAQDLQSAQSTSDAEYLNMVMDNNPDRLEAAYGQLIPVLVQAIKDLKSEIETLKSNA